MIEPNCPRMCLIISLKITDQIPHVGIIQTSVRNDKVLIKRAGRFLPFLDYADLPKKKKENIKI